MSKRALTATQPLDMPRGKGSLPANGPMSHTRLSAARDSIKVAWVIRQLQDHVAGIRPMSVTQLGAAKLLLDKAMPDSQLRVIDGIRGPVTFELTIADAQVL